jgi:hypothetical protein
VTLTWLLRLHALLAAIYALGLLAFPRLILSLLSGGPLDPAGVAITRLFGAALVLVTLLAWGASQHGDRPLRQLVTTALFVYTTLWLLLTLLGQVTGTWNRLGWINVASYLIFVLGYGYYLFIRPE